MGQHDRWASGTTGQRALEPAGQQANELAVQWTHTKAHVCASTHAHKMLQHSPKCFPFQIAQVSRIKTLAEKSIENRAPESRQMDVKMGVPPNIYIYIYIYIYK